MNPSIPDEPGGRPVRKASRTGLSRVAAIATQRNLDVLDKQSTLSIKRRLHVHKLSFHELRCGGWRRHGIETTGSQKFRVQQMKCYNPNLIPKSLHVLQVPMAILTSLPSLKPGTLESM